MNQINLEISVSLGKDEITYILAQTNAPESYDGFGTFTLKDYTDSGDNRWVLIEKTHLEWQSNRYWSGLYKIELEEEESSIRIWVQNELWERLTGRKDR